MILYLASASIALENILAASGTLVDQSATTAAQPAPPPRAATPDPDARAILRGPNGERLTPEQERAMRALIAKNPALRSMLEQAEGHEASPPGAPKDVVVNGARSRGSVNADLPPLRVYRPEEITALGATSVSDLVQKLQGNLPSNPVGGNRAPVVLLNGRRIASFAEIADVPSEAVLRTEIFPPEVAVQYGFLPTQPVVNIVLLERFVTRVADGSVTAPTGGGYDLYSGAATLFRVRGDTRLNLALRAQTNASLSDSQRGIIEPTPLYGPPAARDLLSAASGFAGDATIATRLFDPVVSTFNLHADSNRSNLRLGVLDGTPIGQRTRADTLHAGTTQAGVLHNWQWTLTATADRTVTRTNTTGSPWPDAASARSIDIFAGARLLVAGAPLTGPAGPIGVTVSIGDDYRRFGSTTLPHSGIDAVLHRNQGSATASFTAPIADRKKKYLSGLGYMSVNGNIELHSLSDRGTLLSYGYGLHWTPVGGVTLQADRSHVATAPTLEQLNAPLIATPNVPYYDLLTGRTFSIDQVAGGNPSLRSQKADTIRLGVTLKPFKAHDLNVIADYVDATVQRPITVFPLGIPATQAILLERFRRNADGLLTFVNATGLNFDRRKTRLMRLGFNFSHALGSTPPDLKELPISHVGSVEDIKRVLPPGATAVEVAPGSAEASAFDVLSSRILLSLYLTHRFEDRVRLAPGTASLDLLDGAAIDYLGGTPQNELKGEFGLYRKGIGLNVSGSWRSATRVTGAAVVGPMNLLSFRQFGTVNASLFADLGVLLYGGGVAAALSHFRLSLMVTNLANRRPLVTNAFDATPLGYQQGYLDPIGRTVALAARARF